MDNNPNAGETIGIKYCKRCLMPNSRPRIHFDEDGICNACHTSDQKDEIDWAARRAEFHEYLEKFRPTEGQYDCVVPWSGGKDSTSIAYRLKHEFGLRPLLATFSPLLPNEVGAHNREVLLQDGFDQVSCRPDQRISRHLSRRFFIERGNPKVHWDAGVAAFPVQVAIRYKIPLVFYAEHGPSEYGGHVLSEENRKIQDFTEVLENQIGDHPENWMDDVVSERDLAPYLLPEIEEVEQANVKALYFGYFFRWSMLENYEFIKDKMDFRVDPKGRTDGTFTNFDSLDDKIDNFYYHMQFVKFGFGRATRDACRMIQNGQLTREEGLKFVRDYDDEFPSTYFSENLEYLGMTEPECREIIDLHRNQEIWKLDGNQWKLRYPPS
jgi:N-acetyl sugar amidotransferase